MDTESLSVKSAIIAGVLVCSSVWFVRYLVRSHIVVNCWFCNCNSRVHRSNWNSWICSHCEQYNGFLPNGDYNRDLPQHRDETLNSSFVCRSGEKHSFSSSNGLCENCNRNQELKVSRLATFHPVNPKMFDKEVENFRCHLEEAYPLCTSCELVLNNVLSRKKSLILDMHLKITGQKSRERKPPAALDALKVHLLLRTAAAVTMALALMLVVSTTWKLALHLNSSSISPTVFKTTSHEPTNTSSNELPSSRTNTLSSFFILVSNISASSKSFTSLSSMRFENQIYKVLNIGPSYHPTLLLSGATVQAFLTWYSKRSLSLFLWLLQVALMFKPYALDKNHLALQGILVVEVALAWIILVISMVGGNHRKVRPPTPVKRLSRPNVCSRNSHQQGELISNLRESKAADIQHNEKITEEESKGVIPSPRASLIKFDKLSQPTESTPKLCMPPDNSVSLPTLSVASPVEPIPATGSTYVTSRPESVLSKSRLSLSGLLEQTYSQDDARSDASIDSAISNPDSSVLDATESNISLLQQSSSYSIGTSRMKTGDFDVNLIQGLNLGSGLHKEKKKTHEFEKRQYGTASKKKSILSPPKLVKTLNESSWGAGGFWQAHHGSNGVVVGNVSVNSFPDSLNLNPLSRSSSQSSGFVSLSGQNQHSRPASPCSSVHSQDVDRSSMLSEASTPQNRTAAWGPQSPMSALSPLCIPPASSNPLYRASGSVFGSPHFSQVIYTPFGFHPPPVSPLWNPAMFMMPSHATPSAFSESSSFLHNSQQSRSFNSTSTSIKPMDDSDYDADGVVKKSHKKKIAGMSRSFMESVWQSRFAIVYTTICYVVLGTILCAFWHSGLMIDIATSTFSLK